MLLAIIKPMLTLRPIESERPGFRCWQVQPGRVAAHLTFPGFDRGTQRDPSVPVGQKGNSPFFLIGMADCVNLGLAKASTSVLSAWLKKVLLSDRHKRKHAGPLFRRKLQELRERTSACGTPRWKTTGSAPPLGSKMKLRSPVIADAFVPVTVICCKQCLINLYLR